MDIIFQLTNAALSSNKSYSDRASVNLYPFKGIKSVYRKMIYCEDVALVYDITVIDFPVLIFTIITLTGVRP